MTREREGWGVGTSFSGKRKVEGKTLSEDSGLEGLRRASEWFMPVSRRSKTVVSVSIMQFDLKSSATYATVQGRWYVPVVVRRKEW